MKKTLLLLLLCANFQLVKAQNPQGYDVFNTYTNTMSVKLSDASKAKDTKLLLDLMLQWLNAFDKQSGSVQDKFRNYLPNMYYNVACYQALGGQKSQAIVHFKKAVNAGYTNYAHAAKDSDLDILRKDKQFIDALQEMRRKGDFGYMLKNSGAYRINAYPTAVRFTYQAASTPELVALKKKYNLDSISGTGDEISQIKNLLNWVHNLVKHDGSSTNPVVKNAADLIEISKKENRGLNCRMLATILNDVYQAQGFASRFITCMPKDPNDFDCHVINSVWSKTLNKWLWMDPTNNAYVSDEKGNLLSIEEVRTRLINNLPLVLNEDANWNNQNKRTKEEYLYGYMSKNLYWFKSSVKSEWDLETYKKDKPPIEYVNLYPGEHTTIGGKSKKIEGNNIEYATGNPAYFWQKPYQAKQ